MESIHTKIVKTILILEFKLKLFKFLRKMINEAFYHVEIQPSSFKNIKDIKDMRMPHPYNIIVHGNSIIKNKVTIFHNTTIGVIESIPIPPQIEDNVYIGTGSIILGNITCKKSCKIAAGSIVLKDVPEKLTVTGLWK